MTTVASGRCTSLPGAGDSAIGTKPSAATSAVISTGRSRSSAARAMASRRRRALRLQLTGERDEHEPVQDRDAEQRDEADAGRDAERDVAQPERDDAADDRERDVEEDEQRRLDPPNASQSRKRISAERERHDDREPRPRARVVLELTAPLDAVARRAAAPAPSTASRASSTTETDVAAAHVELDDEPARLLLAVHQRRAPARSVTSATSPSGTIWPSVDLSGSARTTSRLPWKSMPGLDDQPEAPVPLEDLRRPCGRPPSSR